MSLLIGRRRTVVLFSYGSRLALRAPNHRLIGGSEADRLPGNQLVFSGDHLRKDPAGIHARWFCSRDNPRFDAPKVLTGDQVIGIGETVMMYLELGTAAKRLEAIKERKGDKISTRIRMMFEVFLETQMHVLIPFGFRGDQQGLQDFSTAMMNTAKQSGMASSDMEEYQKLHNECMRILPRKAFGIDRLPQVSVEQMRTVAAQMSAALQNPDFLKMARKAFESRQTEMNSSDIEVRKKVFDQVQEELMIPYMKSVITTCNLPEIKPDENGVVVLQFVLAEHMSDPVVAQNLQAAMMALGGNSPLSPFGGFSNPDARNQ